MKIYLDDERKAPEGWTQCRWPEEVIALIEEGGVSEISLDHDLGDDPRTGYDVLVWLEYRTYRTGKLPPIMAVHSANPPARKRMEEAIKNINSLWAQQGIF